ncbi:hypothetical protein C7212DRAFT_347542 [Tuber magnatum]|uniref:Uncharacterized protein n=1 Tax=Tuber magnatum TaxID=42249 RepID=A0A317SG36_9PEZI|nr:hypothetical protein C7212DRAFT_347542 [Tuber magnatum]
MNCVARYGFAIGLAITTLFRCPTSTRPREYCSDGNKSIANPLLAVVDESIAGLWLMELVGFADYWLAVLQFVAEYDSRRFSDKRIADQLLTDFWRGKIADRSVAPCCRGRISDFQLAEHRSRTRPLLTSCLPSVLEYVPRELCHETDTDLWRAMRCSEEGETLLSSDSLAAGAMLQQEDQAIANLHPPEHCSVNRASGTRQLLTFCAPCGVARTSKLLNPRLAACCRRIADHRLAFPDLKNQTIADLWVAVPQLFEEVREHHQPGLCEETTGDLWFILKGGRSFLGDEILCNWITPLEWLVGEQDRPPFWDEETADILPAEYCRNSRSRQLLTPVSLTLVAEGKALCALQRGLEIANRYLAVDAEGGKRCCAISVVSFLYFTNMYISPLQILKLVSHPSLLSSPILQVSVDPAPVLHPIRARPVQRPQPRHEPPVPNGQSGGLKNSGNCLIAEVLMTSSLRSGQVLAK